MSSKDGTTGDPTDPYFEILRKGCAAVANRFDGVGPGGIVLADIDSGDDSDICLSNLAWGGFYEECLARIAQLPAARLASSTIIELIRTCCYGKDMTLGNTVDHTLQRRLRVKLRQYHRVGEILNQLMLSPGGPPVARAGLPLYFGETNYDGPLRIMSAPDAESFWNCMETARDALREESLARIMDGMLMLSWLAYRTHRYELSESVAVTCQIGLPRSSQVAAMRVMPLLFSGREDEGVNVATAFRKASPPRMFSEWLESIAVCKVTGRRNLSLMWHCYLPVHRAQANRAVEIVKRIPISHQENL